MIPEEAKNTLAPLPVDNMKRRELLSKRFNFEDEEEISRLCPERSPSFFDDPKTRRVQMLFLKLAKCENTDQYFVYMMKLKPYVDSARDASYFKVSANELPLLIDIIRGFVYYIAKLNFGEILPVLACGNADCDNRTDISSYWSPEFTKFLP